MTTTIIFSALAVSASLGIAQTLDPLGAPKGEYLVSSRPCADLDAGVGSLELIEFDGRSITLGASECKLAGVTRSQDIFQASCSERGSRPTTTTLRISRPSERSLSVNGTVYNYCKGL